MARFALSVWLLACLLAPLQATTLERLTLDDMIVRSTAIVRGRVVSSQAVLHTSLIYTHLRVQVTERYKGANESVLDVVVPGGTVRGIRQSFAGTPDLTAGGEYLLFLWTGKSGLTHVIGLCQGAMSLGKDSKGDLVISRAASGEPMFDSSGKPVSDAGVYMRLRDMSARISATLTRAERF